MSRDRASFNKSRDKAIVSISRATSRAFHFLFSRFKSFFFFFLNFFFAKKKGETTEGHVGHQLVLSAWRMPSTLEAGKVLVRLDGRVTSYLSRTHKQSS